MKRAWRDDFTHVGIGNTTTIPTAAGGVQIPTGEGNWVAQSVAGTGTISAIDGEDTAPGIIELRTNSSISPFPSQCVLYKGIKSNDVDPVFGFAPMSQVRRMTFKVRIPGSFATAMGFRLALTNRPKFPDAGPVTVGILYDHNPS